MTSEQGQKRGEQQLSQLTKKVQDFVSKLESGISISDLGNYPEDFKKLISNYVRMNGSLNKPSSFFDALQELQTALSEKISTIRAFNNEDIIQSQQKRYLLESLDLSEEKLKMRLGAFIIRLYESTENINIDDIFVMEQYRRVPVMKNYEQIFPKIKDYADSAIKLRTEVQKFEQDNSEKVTHHGSQWKSYIEVTRRPANIEEQLQILIVERDKKIIALVDYVLETDRKLNPHHPSLVPTRTKD